MKGYDRMVRRGLDGSGKKGLFDIIGEELNKRGVSKRKVLWDAFCAYGWYVILSGIFGTNKRK